LHSQGIQVRYQSVYSLYADMVEDGDFSKAELPAERATLLVAAWIAEHT
jgi:hypothetical protein